MIPVSRPSTGPEELAAIGRVLESGWLGMGSTTNAFEEEIKKVIGGRHVIAVNTGTSALHIALDAFGVGPGDEVLLPSITYAASVQAIIATGAVPVFCESREADLLIDIDDVKRKITERTKAVMPVHYCGQACDMDALLTLAEENHFWVIEDAAHAFGSTYRGRKVGSFGHATCFSFDPIKVITCGEGGAVVVQDDEKAELIRRKRLLGIDKDTWYRYKNTRTWFYEVTTLGYRYHMPNFCAAIGLTQLQKLEQFIRKRRDICRRYDAAFANLQTVLPLKINYDETVPFMYIVRVLNGQRDAFIGFLKERGVDTGIHYIPNHLHPFFKQYVREPLKRSTELGEQIVTLPLFYAMTEAEIQTVSQSVLDFDRYVAKET
jgi:perosamine synthetase